MINLMGSLRLNYEREQFYPNLLIPCEALRYTRLKCIKSQKSSLGPLLNASLKEV